MSISENGVILLFIGLSVRPKGMKAKTFMVMRRGIKKKMRDRKRFIAGLHRMVEKASN